jgi:hypothetical protein
VIRRTASCIAVLFSSLLTTLRAQSTGVQTSVRVVAIDSASGEVLRRALLWKFRRTPTGLVPAGSAMADSDGVIQLDSIVAWPVQVACAGQRIFDNHKVADLDEATVSAAAPTDTIRLRVDGTKCDRRPLVAEYSVWVGHYVSGFEESRLQLCNDSTRGVWVEYSKEWLTQPQPEWPEANNRYYPRYFVGFRGRMIGPYHYGHMGVADYELLVDSVLFVRSPRETDCPGMVRRGS